MKPTVSIEQVCRECGFEPPIIGTPLELKEMHR